MTYETAKKLKEAGFPQYGSGLYEAHFPPIEVMNYTGDDLRTPSVPVSEKLYIPTLSELIEALDVPIEWMGRTIGGSYRVDADDASFISENSYEEAVANLWLALNRKEKE